MNRILFTLLALMGTCLTLSAQVNQGISYQAVVRSTDGNPLPNQEVSFWFRYTPSGDTTQVTYAETFTAQTNAFGLVNLVLTTGNLESGSLDALDFAAADYFLITYLDVDGGTNFELMGSTPFEKVPYAAVAQDVLNKDDADADPANEIQLLSVSGDQLTLSQGGGSITLPPSEDADADPTNELELPQDATAGDIAYYDGTNWVSVPDGSGGQTLTLKNDGTPQWAGLSTEMLLEYTLPNGEILYAHPTDNATNIGWNPTNTTSVTNGLNELQTASFPEFSQNFSGESQTSAITAFYGSDGTYAAKLCEELVAFGFDDWFLPSGGELLNLTNSTTSNLSNQLYWTSNLDNGGAIVSLNGETGAFSSGTSTLALRCVRK